MDNEDNIVIWGYCRVSTVAQDVQSQKASIFEYANKEHYNIDRIVETQVSSRRGEKERGIDVLKEAAKTGRVHVIIFSELSRLGRSVGQLCQLVDFFKAHKIELHFIKERVILKDGKNDINSKVTFHMFSLLAEIERDLISVRTKAALHALKASGQKLGRKPGSFKLTKHKEEILKLKDMGVKQKVIAEKFNVNANTLSRFLRNSPCNTIPKGLKNLAENSPSKIENL